MEKAAAMVGLEIPQEQISPQENAAMQRRKRYFKLMAEAAAWYQQCLWQKGPNAKSYLQSRGLNAELAKCFSCETLKDGVFSLWKGQSPIRLRPCLRRLT